MRRSASIRERDAGRGSTTRAPTPQAEAAARPSDACAGGQAKERQTWRGLHADSERRRAERIATKVRRKGRIIRNAEPGTPDGQLVRHAGIDVNDRTESGATGGATLHLFRPVAAAAPMRRSATLRA